ncbi:hypothetical protein HDV05_006080 [Chytridiales sp. JEL 0842]|nr:hypothetical protein HDV05_006080 [Chytridiales sp. JEL 0842]
MAGFPSLGGRQRQTISLPMYKTTSSNDGDYDDAKGLHKGNNKGWMKRSWNRLPFILIAMLFVLWLFKRTPEKTDSVKEDTQADIVKPATPIPPASTTQAKAKDDPAAAIGPQRTPHVATDDAATPEPTTGSEAVNAAEPQKPGAPAKGASKPHIPPGLEETPEMFMARIESYKEPEERRDAVAAAFSHAFDAYYANAWGHDELKPVSKSGSDWLHLGLTVFDSLDTAYIMNNLTIYAKASEWVKSSFKMHADVSANVFETTIRVLGGTLSAYALSKDPEMLKVAHKVGDRLMPAFRESPTKIPLTSMNFHRNKAVAATEVSTAEATTLQMEFKYLSQLTSDETYWNAAQGVMKWIDEIGTDDGLVKIFMNPQTGNFTNYDIRLGSRGDSYYEYLGKLYLLTNKSEEGYLRMYRESISGIKKHLLWRSSPSNLLYVRELPWGLTSTPSDKMDHLVCFLPATLALVATEGRMIKKEDRKKMLKPWQQEDLYLAEELARTCYEMYHQTPTGIAPELVVFNATKDEGAKKDIETMFDSFRFEDKADIEPPTALPTPDGLHAADFFVKSSSQHNLLRPEAVEAFFTLYRVTGDEKYREWGWNVFKAFERYSRLPEGGYTCLDSVMTIPPPRQDKMESFFMSETLKYLYLLFTDPSVIPLDKFIFNTEAHPIPVFDVHPNLGKKVVMIEKEQKLRNQKMPGDRYT